MVEAMLIMNKKSSHYCEPFSFINDCKAQSIIIANSLMNKDINIINNASLKEKYRRLASKEKIMHSIKIAHAPIIPFFKYELLTFNLLDKIMISKKASAREKGIEIAYSASFQVIESIYSN